VGLIISYSSGSRVYCLASLTLCCPLKVARDISHVFVSSQLLANSSSYSAPLTVSGMRDLQRNRSLDTVGRN
jgi:hypothetical protein